MKWIKQSKYYAESPCGQYRLVKTFTGEQITWVLFVREKWMAWDWKPIRYGTVKECEDEINAS